MVIISQNIVVIFWQTDSTVNALLKYIMRVTWCLFWKNNTMQLWSEWKWRTKHKCLPLFGGRNYEKHKNFFSSLTVAFAILGLTKALSTDITMPIMFICMVITMFITAKEYKELNQKNMAVYFLLLGIFLLVVTVYNLASIIWGI